MPYNFREMRPYSIDYEDLEKALLAIVMPRSPIAGEDKEAIRDFIQGWIRHLQWCDWVVTNQMEASGAIDMYLRGQSSEPEIFQTTVYIGNNAISLAFRISPIRQALFGQRARAEDVPIRQLIEEEKALWTEEPSPSTHPITDPLIVAPFPVGGKKLLVIDGNHRLSMAIKQKAESIPVYFVSAKTLIDQPLFSSWFDQSFYAMLTEVNKISNSPD